MGAPVGNTNASHDKPWQAALKQAVNIEDPKMKRAKLINIAYKVVELAERGDMQAIMEIGNRLDGRPKQQSEITGADGGPLDVRWASAKP